MQLSSPSISSPDVEFTIRFVKFGAFNRPATWRTVRVLAADRAGAKKIVKQHYPRSERYEIVAERELLKAAA